LLGNDGEFVKSSPHRDALSLTVRRLSRGVQHVVEYITITEVVGMTITAISAWMFFVL
jgi:hypothetical protein